MVTFGETPTECDIRNRTYLPVLWIKHEAIWLISRCVLASLHYYSPRRNVFRRGQKGKSIPNLVSYISSPIYHIIDVISYVQWETQAAVSFTEI